MRGATARIPAGPTGPAKANAAHPQPGQAAIMAMGHSVPALGHQRALVGTAAPARWLAGPGPPTRGVPDRGRSGRWRRPDTRWRRRNRLWRGVTAMIWCVATALTRRINRRGRSGRENPTRQRCADSWRNRPGSNALSSLRRAGRAERTGRRQGIAVSRQGRAWRAGAGASAGHIGRVCSVAAALVLQWCVDRGATGRLRRNFPSLAPRCGMIRRLCDAHCGLPGRSGPSPFLRRKDCPARWLSWPKKSYASTSKTEMKQSYLITP